MEVGEYDVASEICSGKLGLARWASLGSVIGRSSLPWRRAGSNLRVMGLNGPSRVVGIEKEEDMKRKRKMRIILLELRNLENESDEEIKVLMGGLDFGEINVGNMLGISKEDE